jgi:Icc-related predicted phosphoesterase
LRDALGSNFEVDMEAKKTLKIAALADIHYGRGERKELAEILAEATSACDILLLCGDLTDHGRPKEAKMLLEDLRTREDVQVFAVLGNHDMEGEDTEEFVDLLQNGGVSVLDGECAAVGPVGFAGVKGFCGGFGNRSVHPFGEVELKDFINVTVEEALKLETALSRLDTRYRVVVLHYAPIRQTVEGEPPEIFPFLGSSRLEDPINHYEATVVFHGHAHKGAPVGATSQGIPVYNVSVPVLKKAYPERPAFRVYEIELDPSSV